MQKSSAWLIPSKSCYILNESATIGAISINEYPNCVPQAGKVCWALFEHKYQCRVFVFADVCLLTSQKK